MRVRIAASALPMVTAGKTRFAKVPEPETGSHPSLMANSKIRMGPRAKLGNDRPKRLTTLMARSSQSITAPGGANPRGNREQNRHQERSDRELQSVGVALDEQLADALVVADGDAQVAVQDALPVVQVLLRRAEVEAVGMARGLRCRRQERLRPAFAEWGRRAPGGSGEKQARPPAR